MSTRYPFTAVVGMDDLRLALLLNAGQPGRGRCAGAGREGHREEHRRTGARAICCPRWRSCRAAASAATPPRPTRSARTGRTRAVPALPARRAWSSCPSAPPRTGWWAPSTSSGRSAEGVKAFEPGLLADAHRGILYVDEVNLLHDHLIDLLLDAAAMGSSYVEREGVSVRHAARFLLVGTMNPEEGELRPQLLDRFGLTVEVAASREPEQRVEVVRRRLAYDDDPAAFAARWADEEGALRQRIMAARELLPSVALGDAVLLQIAATCAAFEVDGMRADIVMARTATALAAWAGRTEVTGEDVRQAALLALPHRRGATRSTRRAWTRTSSTRRWSEFAGRGPEDDDPDPGPEGPGGGGGGGADAAAGRLPGGPAGSRRARGRDPPTPWSRRAARPASGPGERAAVTGRRAVPYEDAERARARRGRGGPALAGPYRPRQDDRFAPPPRARSPSCT